MIHDYDNPNTCYAIGDAFAVFLGTAATNRQPASGVAEQIGAVIKPTTVDQLQFTDGTNSFAFLEAETKTGVAEGDGNEANAALMPHNMALVINNSVYFKKSGTTDRCYIAGVQVDA